MDKIVINGGVRLEGEITAGGAKNAALPILVATLLSDGKCTIKRVPTLRDIHTILRLLESVGSRFSFENDVVEIETPSIKRPVAPYDLVRTMRAGVLLLGPLVARTGYAEVSLPGGCAIGERPINLHLEGLSKLGARVSLEKGYVKVDAANGLKGAHIYLDIPTVTGTMNIMMAATAADGITSIENAAREPEVCDLASFLRSMGADIRGDGTSVIEIKGGSTLRASDHEIIPDRIEAGTYLAAAAITGGEIAVKNCVPEHMLNTLEKFKDVGCEVETGGDWVSLKHQGGRLRGCNIKTLPYPGFATDMQAQFMALLSLAEGTSIITETIFENRFMHVAELKRMGADIKISGASAVVDGVASLKGADVMATDLRASASLVLAGLAAEGTTVIHRIYHLDRGYERMEEKLSALGADIRRESE